MPCVPWQSDRDCRSLRTQPCAHHSVPRQAGHSLHGDVASKGQVCVPYQRHHAGEQHLHIASVRVSSGCTQSKHCLRVLLQCESAANMQQKHRFAFGRVIDPTLCSGGTKRKLTNWKTGHSFQFATMASFQSCFSFGTASPGLPCSGDHPRVKYMCQRLLKHMRQSHTGQGVRAAKPPSSSSR